MINYSDRVLNSSATKSGIFRTSGKKSFEINIPDQIFVFFDGSFFFSREELRFLTKQDFPFYLHVHCRKNVASFKMVEA